MHFKTYALSFEIIFSYPFPTKNIKSTAKKKYLDALSNFFSLNKTKKYRNTLKSEKKDASI
jgi:hypothetical protein